MTHAQPDVSKSLQSRKRFKLSIASAIFVLGFVYCFAPDNIHIPGTDLAWSPPWRGAPQSAMTQEAPAHVSQVPDDANAPAQPAQAPIDTGSLTILSDRDGSPIRVVIPAEPTGDFGPPDYSSDLDPDVGLYGHESGINAIHSLATSTAAGETVADAFRSVVTDGGGVREGADAGYTDSGAILLAVWYQRAHPGISFGEAANALTRLPPNMRMIKKAAQVARGWVAAFNSGNYSYEYKMSARDSKMRVPN